MSNDGLASPVTTVTPRQAVSGEWPGPPATKDRIVILNEVKDRCNPATAASSRWISGGRLPNWNRRSAWNPRAYNCLQWFLSAATAQISL